MAREALAAFALVCKYEEQERTFSSTRTLSIGKGALLKGGKVHLISMLTILTEINKHSYYFGCGLDWPDKFAI
ncbi:hypothetical protein B9Z46_12465 [Limnohabitans sp. Hippo4]|nr:hypothetical protein B9Z46_12465 [Limnohabitans sp. Hippo4]